ncbi:MAG: WD40 repeat domain-containing protein [Bacteroidota bacterium]
MIAHKSPISGIATFQNQYVATAGYDNVLILWDGKNGRSLGRGCHDHLVNQCTFSPDGKLLASSSSDYTARIWSVPDMKLQCILSGHTDDVEGLSFHPTKNWIATSSRDASIRIYDLNGQHIRTLEGHEDDVISVEWMKGRDILVSSSDDGTVKYWDAITGKILKDLSFNDVETDTVAIAAEGTIFAGNDEGEIVVIREDHEPVMVPAHEAGIKRLVYSDAVNKLISLSYDRTFKIWLFDGEKISLDSDHQFNNMVWPRSCAFLNEQEVVFGTFGIRYAQYDIEKCAWVNGEIEPTYGINAVCEVEGNVYTIGDAGFVFRNGEKIAEMGSLCNFIIEFEGHVITGGQTGEVFDARTGDVYYQHNSPLNCATNFQHNGRPALAVGTYTGEGIVFTLDAQGQVVHQENVSLHDNAIKGISASKKYIFSVCATGAAAFHDVDTFACNNYISDGHWKIANGCVNFGEDAFASISRDLHLRVWNSEEANVIATSHRNSIKSIASDDSGRYLALGDYTGFVSMYDKEQGDFIRHMRISDFGISSICYSKSGNKFIASCYDGKPYDIVINQN